MGGGERGMAVKGTRNNGWVRACGYHGVVAKLRATIPWDFECDGVLIWYGQD